MKVAAVRDIATQVRGVTYKKNDAVLTPRDGYVPLLRGGNVTPAGQISYEDLQFVPTELVKTVQRLRRHDVVVVASSGSIDVVGKSAQVDVDNAGTFGAFCKVLRPGPEVDPRYFGHFFRTDTYRRAIRALAAGANINNIKNSHLDDLSIPLPPLPEQRRIADILDRADVLRRQRARAAALVGQLGPAIFNQMFSTRTEDSVPLGDIAAIDSGITKGRKLKSGALTREMPYLAVANVQDRHLRLDEVKTLAVTDAEIVRYRLQADDLLLTEGGDPDKLGRGVLWDASVDVMLHQNHIFRVRLHEDAPVSPMFLSWAVSAPASKRYFLRQAKQTTGIATINKRQLSGLPVPVPKNADQAEFSMRISAIRRQQNLAAKSAIEVEALFSSLQSRAFRGEL